MPESWILSTPESSPKTSPKHSRPSSDSGIGSSSGDAKRTSRMAEWPAMAVHQRRTGSPLRPESHGLLTTERDAWLHADADQYERAYDSCMVVRLVAWVHQPSTGARGGAPRQSFYVEVDAETHEDAERHVRAQLDPGWLLRAWRV